MQYFAFTAA